MISMQTITTDFFIMSMYSVLLGFILFINALISIKIKSYVTIWKDYWIVILGLCLLPLVFSFIPNTHQDYSVFDVSLLHLTSTDKSVIIPSNNHYDLSMIKQTFDTMSVISNLWLTIYLFGFVYMLKELLNQIKLVNSIIKNAKSLDNQLELKFNYLEKLINLENKYNIKVHITPMTISPFVYQWRKKYLILPSSLFNEKNLTKDQVDLIVEHELNHLNSHDQIMVMMSHILICVMWFNPFVRYFRKNLNWAIEAHCDREVLKQKPHLRKIYAQTMLQILRQSATKTSNHMVAAFSTKTHRSLTMRINNIMKPLHPEVKLNRKKKKLWATAFTIGLAMFITQPQSFAASDDNKITMVNPVKQAKVTSKYGANNKFHQFHKGIDLGAKINTPIVATGNGVVRVSTDLLENRKNYGTLIIIDHDDGFHSVYAHLNSRNVVAGDKVEAGQLIGYVGETGKASGPHLHLELLKDNKHVNPSDFIQF